MNIKRIVQFLNASNKLLYPILNGNEQLKGLASAYLLIMAGERINEVLQELQIFVLDNKTLFKKLLQQTHTEFDNEKYKTMSFEKKQAYAEQAFRTAFNQTFIGSHLLLLNTLRSQTKHRFFSLTLQEQALYCPVYAHTTISAFLEEVRKLIRTFEENPHELVQQLFTNNTLKSFQNEATEKLLNVFSIKQKKKKKHSGIETQEKKLLSRLQGSEKLKETLETCLQLLKNQDASKGNLETTILHATLMAITLVGENATQLIAYRKNETAFAQELRQILLKYHKALSDLSHLATLLTHAAELKFSVRDTINFGEETLAHFDTLKQLQLELTNEISLVKNKTASSIQEEKAIKVPEVKEAPSLKLSESVVHVQSPIFTPLAQTAKAEKEKEKSKEKRRKGKELLLDEAISSSSEPKKKLRKG